MRHLDWVDGLPDQWEAKPLRATAGYVVSNVDKVPAECEMPVRLCNYTDVYNNEFITLALDFMQSTASEDEIRKFKLLVDDVVITKDSESWDDIGVPAHVRETAGDLVCGYHLALLRPHKQRVDGAFLFRCLQAKPIRVQLELAAAPTSAGTREFHFCGEDGCSLKCAFHISSMRLCMNGVRPVSNS